MKEEKDLHQLLSHFHDFAQGTRGHMRFPFLALEKRLRPVESFFEAFHLPQLFMYMGPDQYVRRGFDA